MARIRTIKPEFPQSESMGRVSREARLLFIMLWTQADDSGRLRGNSRMLASVLYPYDEDAGRLIDGWMDELEQSGSIRRYQVDGLSYVDIPKWLSHQKIDKPSRSKIPEFVESSRDFANPLESSSGEGKGMEGKGSISPSDLSSADAKDQSVDREAGIPYQSVVNEYNRICGDLFPQVSKLTDKRRKAIKARWLGAKDQGTDSLVYWSKYFAHCRNDVEFFRKAATGGLAGQHSGWVPDFDFLMTESKWLGVVEGRYV